MEPPQPLPTERRPHLDQHVPFKQNELSSSPLPLEISEDACILPSEDQVPLTLHSTQNQTQTQLGQDADPLLLCHASQADSSDTEILTFPSASVVEDEERLQHDLPPIANAQQPSRSSTLLMLIQQEGSQSSLRPDEQLPSDIPLSLSHRIVSQHASSNPQSPQSSQNTQDQATLDETHYLPPQLSQTPQPASPTLSSSLSPPPTSSAINFNISRSTSTSPRSILDRSTGNNKTLVEVIIELPSVQENRDNETRFSSPIPSNQLEAASQENAHPHPDDEALAKATAMLPPSPPRRQLRERNARQLNPYTLEAIRYQRTLIRNDWEDAVISQREWNRQERRRIREEQAKAAVETGGDSQSQWMVPDTDDESPDENLDATQQEERETAEKRNQHPLDNGKGKSKYTPAPTAGIRNESNLSHQLDPNPQGSLNRIAGASTSAYQSASLIPRPPTTVQYGRKRKGKDKQAPLTGQGPSLVAEPASLPPSSLPLQHDSEPSSSPVMPSRKIQRIRSVSSVEKSHDSSTDDDQITPVGGSIGLPKKLDKSLVISIESESSADEISIVTPKANPIKRPRKTNSQWANGSSSDSTDYDRRFRQLKKMMPAAMARKHIQDLRAMRHGKAYHSDGHYSSTPSPSDGQDQDDSQASDQDISIHPVQDSTPSTSPFDVGELRPGEARKRLRQSLNADGDAATSKFLLFEGDSESDDASSTSTGSRLQPVVASSESEDDSWWAHRKSSIFPNREKDVIDRMLSRTTSGSNRTRAKSNSSRRRRQMRLDPYLSVKDPRSKGKRKLPLQQVSVNQSRSLTAHQATSPIHDSFLKKKKRKNLLDPRIGRPKRSYHGASSRPANPPVVRPRIRPRLDLVTDDALFATMTLSSTDLQTLEVDEDEDALSMLRTDHQTSISRSSPAGKTRAHPQNDSGWRRSVTASNSSNHVASLVSPEADPSSPTDLGRPPLYSRSLYRQNSKQGQHVLVTPQKAHPLATPRSAGNTAANFSSPSSVGVTGSSARVSRDVEAQKVEAESWDDYQGIRVDFGIHPLPVGISFASNTYLGRGRMFELLKLSEQGTDSEHALPRSWYNTVIRIGDDIELRPTIDADKLFQILPTALEEVARRLGAPDEMSELLELGEGISTKEPGGDAGIPSSTLARILFEDVSRFLCLWLTAQLLQPGTSVSESARCYHAMVGQMEMFLKTIKTYGPVSEEVRLAVWWFRVELCWRMLVLHDSDGLDPFEHNFPTIDEFVQLCRLLMMILLRHGIHKTMKQVKATASVTITEAQAGHPTARLDHLEVDQPQQQQQRKPVTDYPAGLWVCLIHLLEISKRLGITDTCSPFWDHFEAVFQVWQSSTCNRGQVLASESIWYCIISLTALSQFSASTGSSLSQPHLRASWQIVCKALNLVRFRLDGTVEETMSFPALLKRDQYIRAILTRCLMLSDVWCWQLDGCDVAFAKLFDIFNSHKLADLPSENDHDFPGFLRDFDEQALEKPARRSDTCFHIFLKLLSRAGRDLRRLASDDVRDGDRRISRLFSRISPVRVMVFTKTDVPTSSQRSMLFNHYAVVMLFLYLVPSSWAQRLRQIKSFLPFKEADFLSQLTCIRAMMYAAVIFRHHQLDVAPITSWFGEVIETLMREYEILEKTTGLQRRKNGQSPLEAVFENTNAMRVARRRQSDVARLIVAVLRSIQHVIQQANLKGSDGSVDGKTVAYPDLKLLHKSWTKDVLEAQLAVEPSIGQEAMKCIQTFLLERNKAVQPVMTVNKALNPHVNGSKNLNLPIATVADEDSQDSFAALFEDTEFDFDDPALVDLLDGGSAASRPELGLANTDTTMAASIASAKLLDRDFSEYVLSTISPALFRLLSNMLHPDHRWGVGGISMLGITERPLSISGNSNSNSNSGGEGGLRMSQLVEAAERRRYLELVIDCWAGCAHVLVQNGKRQWSSYLGFGNESWRRIDDAICKRDVGLRFLQNLAALDSEALEEHQAEVFAMWFQTAVARVLSIQHLYTRSLLDLQPDCPIVEGWKDILMKRKDDQNDTNVVDTATVSILTEVGDFETVRLQLLSRAFSNCNRVEQETIKKKSPMLFGCLSALLASIRCYVEETPIEASGRREYLEFCTCVLKSMQDKIGTTLLRGVAGELGMTIGFVEKKRLQLSVATTTTGVPSPIRPGLLASAVL